MSTSDPRARRNEDDDRHRGYSATGNAEGGDLTGAGTTERTVTGGGDHPAADHIAADGLPGRAVPHHADLDADGRGYSATGNAAGTGATEPTVHGGGAHPAADHIVADGLPGRADPPRGGFRDDHHDHGPIDPDGPQGPRSEERTR